MEGAPRLSSRDPVATLWWLREESHAPQLAVAFVDDSTQVVARVSAERSVMVSARLRGPAGVIQRVMPLEDVLIESAGGMVVEDLVGPTSEPFAYCAVGGIHLIDVAVDGTETSSLLYAWVLDYQGLAQLPLSDSKLTLASGRWTGRALARHLTFLPDDSPQAARFVPAIRRADHEGIRDQLIAGAWAEGLAGGREWAVVTAGSDGKYTVVAQSGPASIQREGVDLAGVLAGRAHDEIYEEVVGGRRVTVTGADGKALLGPNGKPLRQWISAHPVGDPTANLDALAEEPGRGEGDRLRDPKKRSPVGGATDGVVRLGGRDELEQVLRERSLKPLSNLEGKVAELLSDGLNNGQVAERLDLKIGTVKSLKNRIKQKLKPL